MSGKALPIKRRSIYSTGWESFPNEPELLKAIEIGRERMRGLIETWSVRGPLYGYDVTNLVVSAYLQGVYDMAVTNEEPVVGIGF